MRQLVTFCPDDLPEAFADHFSAGQVAEMAARLEDAGLVMEADQPPARPTPGSGPQHLWLAGGRAASPQRDLEFRALRATAWTDFTQEEVDAMSPIMKQSLTRRLARHEQDAAKAKARAEAEVIAGEAMEAVKRDAAKKREEALNAILREEQLELEKFEKDLAAAKKLSLGEEVDATDPAAASSTAAPPTDTATVQKQSAFPPLPLRPEAKSQVRGRTSEATDTAGTRRRSKSAANKSGVGPEPSLSWNDIFANVCATPVPKGPRADFLATEVLPRGCYIYMEDNQVRTAIGAWDEDNAIFRCAIVCPICRMHPCNRRMWWRLDDHDSHSCDACKD